MSEEPPGDSAPPRRWRPPEGETFRKPEPGHSEVVLQKRSTSPAPRRSSGPAARRSSKRPPPAEPSVPPALTTSDPGIDPAEPLPGPPGIPRDYRPPSLPPTDPAPRPASERAARASERVRDEVQEFQVQIEEAPAPAVAPAKSGVPLGTIVWVGVVLAVVAIIAGAMIGLLVIDDDPERVSANNERETERPVPTTVVIEDPPVEPAMVEPEVDPPVIENLPEDSYDLVPEAPPEIAALDIWVRRERAAELRRDARNLHVGRLYPQAEAKWRQALVYHPTSDEAASGLARSLARQAKIEEAVRYARLAVDLSPRDARNYELLGDLLLAARDQEGARAQYREGLLHAPGDIRLRSRLRRIDY
jgi:hypothetical protein